MLEHRSESKPLRVLIASTGIYPPTVDVTGVKWVLEFARRVQAEGHDVTVVSDSGPTSDDRAAWVEQEVERSGLRTTYVRLARARNTGARLATWTLAMPAEIGIRGLLRSASRFDVLHVFASSPLALAALPLARPAVNRIGLSLITCNTNPWHAWFGRLALRAIRPHFLTAATRQSVARWQTAAPSVAVTRMPLGIDPDIVRPSAARESFREVFNIPPDAVVVLYLNPLRRTKGIRVFLDAMDTVLRQTPEAFALIVSAKRRDGESQRWRRRIGRTRWTAGGRMQLGERTILPVANVLHACDLFVLPEVESHGTFEHPAVLLEAMAMGLPCVATQRDGTAECLEVGPAGQLVPRGSHPGLARAIVGLISDPHRRHTFGTYARTNVNAGFHIHNAVDSSVRLYRSHSPTAPSANDR